MRKKTVWMLFTLVLLVTLGLATALPMSTPALAAGIYEYYNTGDTSVASIYGDVWDAQTFTPSVAHAVTSVKLKLCKIGSGPGTITVGIRATDIDGLPSGADLCSGTTDGNTLPTASQTRLPTGDHSRSGTWDKTTNMYSYVDDDPWNDGDTTYLVHGTAAGYALFTFSPFDVPAGSVITSLQITYSCRDQTTGNNNLRAALRVGGTNYLTTDGGANPGSSYADRPYTYSNNPATGSPWTVDDINGVGSNPLQAFGVGSSDANPAIRITAVKAVVNYDNYEWREITLGSGYSLSANTTYAIVVRAPGGAADDRAYWRYANPGSYDGGILLQSLDSGAGWTSYTNLDFMFEEWGGNTAPTADSQSGLTVDSCDTLTVTLTGSDPENDPLTYMISTLPLYGDLYDGTGTGGTKITSVNYTVTDPAHNVTYEPGVHYSVADSFGFKVNDGEFYSDEATIALGIDGCDDNDYYDDWEDYCVGNEVWTHRMFHDFSCVGGACVEVDAYYTDETFVQDCDDSDYTTEWVYYCVGDSVWRTRDFHDYYCLDGTCLEDVIPESEWYQDCPTDYYTDWAYYCVGDSIWRTRDFHNFSCLNGTCVEDVVPESEWYQDCPADYYTDWGYYCDGDSIWRTRDLHDYYCFNGTCLEDVIPESEWYQDCSADYYTNWVYYCVDDSIWRTRDLHDYYCFNGTCLEDVIPESEFVEDCNLSDYYDAWEDYCVGDEVWTHRMFHDFSCVGGACVEVDSYYTNETFVQDCDDSDYTTEWVYYCVGDSVWRTRDFHDFSCLNGTCVEDVIPESEWYQDCDDGDPCTVDTCLNGTCVHTPLYANIGEYYRGLEGNPDELTTTELLAAVDDWLVDAAPQCFEDPITTPELLDLVDEWLAT